MTRETVRLFGLRIDNLTMGETIVRINQMIEQGGVHQHVVVNVDKVVKASRDPQIADIVNECDLVNVDGQPVVWASRLLGQPLKERVTGIDLMVRLVEESARTGHRLYFLGAKKEILEETVRWARAQGAHIAGYRDGYFKADEENAVADEVAASKADILFMAVPSPKKEIFLNKHKERMGAAFVMGVGGSFDVVAGKVERAPVWMQRSGLEWFYRLYQEPRRMWRRYLVEDAAFVPLVLRELTRRGAA
jgi:N-acetylglucosaminyldiphosphoundecaprenol N-acetyl-beta-D-mannosaminyltransferase